MSLPPRVLLLGGSGQLGTEIRRLWRRAQITAPTHAQLDITDAGAVAAAVRAGGFDVAINCAAFHNVERCEAEPAAAFLHNTLGVNAIAEACARSGITFVTISTDYVFDGTLGRPYNETDAPNPLSVYAASKYAGELLVQRLASHAYVVRTCGVYGVRPSRSKGHTFIDRIIAQARAREPLRIVSDQTVSPTYACHLAQSLVQLLEADAPYGLYHMVNEGPVTWFDYARDALRAAGIDYPVEPISTEDWTSRVRRPKYSALENAKLHELGMTMPRWQDGVRDYLQAVERRGDDD